MDGGIAKHHRKYMEEFSLLNEEDDIELKLDPTDKKPLLSKINPFSMPKLKFTYIADYPIYGTIANLNAFALGAKMVNPRAKIYLDWRCIKDNDTMENIEKLQPSCVSARDMLMPNDETRYFRIYYMDGSWEYDDDSSLIKAINYWWGMSAGNREKI